MKTLISDDVGWLVGYRGHGRHIQQELHDHVPELQVQLCDLGSWQGAQAPTNPRLICHHLNRGSQLATHSHTHSIVTFSIRFRIHICGSLVPNPSRPSFFSIVDNLIQVSSLISFSRFDRKSLVHWSRKCYHHSLRNILV